VDKRRLEILLGSAAHVGANENRDGITMALLLAKSTDGTDVDARIAEFVTTEVLVPNIRIVLIRDVLGRRGNPAVIETLLKFARSTDDVSAAVAALEATRAMATEAFFGDFIDIIVKTKSDQILKAAEENAAQIIGKSMTKGTLLQPIAAAHDAAANDIVRHAMLRLMGRIGGDKALEITLKNLRSDVELDQVAAIVALGSWGDRNGYLALIEFLKTAKVIKIRDRAFSSAFQYAMESETDIQGNWTLLAAQAKTQKEQLDLIRGLVGVKPAPWVFEILQKLVESSDYHEAVDLAERGIIRLKDIEKIEADGGDD
jgi:hypothetical protein